MKKILLGLSLLLTACNQKEQVDTIITAAGIYTCDSQFSTKQAIAIKDGKILATDSKENILKHYTAKELIDVPDKWVFPGFIDAHCHFSGYALQQYKCDLVGTNSFEEVLEHLQDYEKENKLSWIYARGWDQNDWEIKQFPDNTELDRLFPDKPVILKRIDGHAVLCNSKALQLAGINSKTVINGGIIEKKNGRLTGILIDNATGPVEKLIPALPDSVAVKYLQQ
ncbi:MAG: amidohydrolase family protein, partial [Chitinophagaceae bacterium]|nr:amidohydrolase family protein [Chitinophagaceae bacterium]